MAFCSLPDGSFGQVRARGDTFVTPLAKQPRRVQAGPNDQKRTLRAPVNFGKGMQEAGPLAHGHGAHVTAPCAPRSRVGQSRGNHPRPARPPPRANRGRMAPAAKGKTLGKTGRGECPNGKRTFQSRL